MPTDKLHDDEVSTDAGLVRRLLAAQFPEWAELPIVPLRSAGTDNWIYRLGDHLAVRLPRIQGAVGQVEKELRWLPLLAPHLPLAIPVPLVKGAPAEGYPWEWGVYRWLEGEVATLERLDDPAQEAVALAEFVAALQRIDLAGSPRPGEYTFGRGGPLAPRDPETRENIATLEGMIDGRAATSVWEAALRAQAWDGPPVWIHGDLIGTNLLAHEGRLSAVIDFGGLGVGDAAYDLMPAWTLFSGESRGGFRSALSVDDATWTRGRGWALCWAVMYIPYYLHTNPVGVANARRTIDEVLNDHARGKA